MPRSFATLIKKAVKAQIPIQEHNKNDEHHVTVNPETLVLINFSTPAHELVRTHIILVQDIGTVGKFKCIYL